jgi:UDP-N-acetylglucosamine 1-carboxyvinyltransferase
MSNEYLLVKKSPPLTGTVDLVGAKNAVLVIITSLVLTNGVSVLENVPNSADVLLMIKLLEDLGATATFDQEKNILTVDTQNICRFEVKPEIMNKMRASILVAGPLLARFGKAKVAPPGGCLIGARPIDYHLNGFKKMGAMIDMHENFINITLRPYQELPTLTRLILEYPSVGATENLMMLAVLSKGETEIVNAAMEPEVLDLIAILTKMGAKIDCSQGQIIRIKGVEKLNPVCHTIIPDRLQAGAILLAAAITGGSVSLPHARADHMDLFLEKLREMGHQVATGTNPTQNQQHQGISLTATATPVAVNFKTGPYPCFPTDIQAPTMAALCVTNGTSNIEETVFENRLLHVKELQKMGAQISRDGNSKATVRGVEVLYGADVIATDIRASCALVLAGLVAQGQTKITGIHHWRRGYDQLEQKLASMGALIEIVEKGSNLC